MLQSRAGLLLSYFKCLFKWYGIPICTLHLLQRLYHPFVWACMQIGRRPLTLTVIKWITFSPKLWSSYSSLILFLYDSSPGTHDIDPTATTQVICNTHRSSKQAKDGSLSATVPSHSEPIVQKDTLHHKNGTKAEICQHEIVQINNHANKSNSFGSVKKWLLQLCIMRHHTMVLGILNIVEHTKSF